MIALALASWIVTAPSAADAELVSSLVAAAATKIERLDVLSAQDVRSAVDLEAQRAIMGCDETSCLLEVAGAMNARLVVHGTLGSLGDVVVLTLSAFDTVTASALGRVVLQEAKIDALAGKIPDAVVEFLASAPLPTAGARIRTVVLDMKLAAGAPASEAPAPSGSFPWLAASAVGVGVIGLGVGVAADVIAFTDAGSIDATTSIRDANDLQAKREELLAPMAIVGYVVGGLAVATGAVLFGIGSAP